MDLIYGDYIPNSCNSPVALTRKTSIQYKQSIYSRSNSGGPGYIKGNKLLTGVGISTENGTYIN